MLLAEQFPEFQPVADLQRRQYAVVPAERRPLASGLSARCLSLPSWWDDHEARFDQTDPVARNADSPCGSPAASQADRIEEGELICDAIVRSRSGRTVAAAQAVTRREFLRRGRRGRPYRLVGFLGVLGPVR